MMPTRWENSGNGKRWQWIEIARWEGGKGVQSRRLKGDEERKVETNEVMGAHLHRNSHFLNWKGVQSDTTVTVAVSLV